MWQKAQRHGSLQLLLFLGPAIAFMNLARQFHRPIIFRGQLYRSNRRINTGSKVFQEGDVTIIRPSKDPSHVGILSKPLQAGKAINTHHGPFEHSSIIGRQIRDTIETPKGVQYRIYEPTLAEYVRLTPRLVTPIYPSHANLIVSLLDLHVSPPKPSDEAESPLQILEAGTGHGALTLHISRAIHAANSPAPVLRVVDVKDDTDSSANGLAEHEEQLRRWKSARHAILHTLDISARHSNHAHKIVCNFRRGLYYPNIDFHIGDVPSFFGARSGKSNLLSHVVLDMPSADMYLEDVAANLLPNGKLLVFNPSVTQIADCVEVIKNGRLPFHLEQVLELGGGMSGAREWDVRIARIKSADKKTEKHSSSMDSSTSPSFWSLMMRFFSTGQLQVPEEPSAAEREWGVVCRPKVGERVVFGGFVGVWTRKRDVDSD